VGAGREPPPPPEIGRLSACYHRESLFTES
jgi:hypothetical protein